MRTPPYFLGDNDQGTRVRRRRVLDETRGKVFVENCIHLLRHWRITSVRARVDWRIANRNGQLERIRWRLGKRIVVFPQNITQHGDNSRRPTRTMYFERDLSQRRKLIAHEGETDTLFRAQTVQNSLRRRSKGVIGRPFTTRRTRRVWQGVRSLVAPQNGGHHRTRRDHHGRIQRSRKHQKRCPAERRRVEDRRSNRRAG